MGQKELEELCDLRASVEGHAVGRAALRWNELQLREIKFALEAMRSLTETIVAAGSEKEQLSRLVREDVRVHIAMHSGRSRR